MNKKFYLISLCSSWVIYEHKQYTGNLYVLSEGDYPNLTSMGCPPTFAIRSIKAVPMVRKALALKTKERSHSVFPPSDSL